MADVSFEVLDVVESLLVADVLAVDGDVISWGVEVDVAAMLLFTTGVIIVALDISFDGRDGVVVSPAGHIALLVPFFTAINISSLHNISIRVCPIATAVDQRNSC